MITRRIDFEQGPIRPPNEAKSLLLRFTRNCPWNQCLFCPVYKRKRFSRRSVEEIKADIDKAREMIDDIKALSWKLGCSGSIDDQVISFIFNSGSYSASFRQVAGWLYYDTGACFLQDADNLIMSTADLVETLSYLRKRIPEIRRVTTYSRSRTVIRKSVEDLGAIKKAGLDRVHIGLETGNHRLLKFMKKGVSPEQHVQAGRLLIEAGIELSEYVMPGLGGQEMSKEHALDTAKVLNRINPDFIRLRSLRIPPRVPLYQKVADGSFTPLTDDMLAKELKLFITALDGITSRVTSDHIMNLFEDLAGKLPDDKEKMLSVIDDYLGMDEEDRLIYRLGRRGGAFRGPSDLRADPALFAKLKNLVKETVATKGYAGVEELISEMVDQYI